MFLPFRGNPFSPWRSLAGPSRAFSNPFVALRRSSWPFVDMFLPFRGNPFSPWRSLAGPSRASSNALVALRRSSWPFVDFFLPFRGNPFSPWRSLAGPSRASSNPLVALRRSWKTWPFVDPWLGERTRRLFAFSRKSFLPLAILGRPLSSLLQPLSGPSPFFVALRGYVFAFSRKSFLPLAIPWQDSLSSLLQRCLSGPSPFFVALRGCSFWNKILFVEIGAFSPWRSELAGPS